MTAIVVLVLGGANYYLAKKLFKWFVLFIPKLNPVLFIGLFTLLGLGLLLGSFYNVYPTFLKQALNWIGSY